VKPEMNTTEAAGSPVMVSLGSITMDAPRVLAIRQSLHELANILTGVLIAGGLLAQFLESGSLQQYASNVCESGERGSALVREIRSQLLASCGEREVGVKGNSAGGVQEQ